MADRDTQAAEALGDENLEQAAGGTTPQEMQDYLDSRLQDYLDSYRTSIEQANQAIKDTTEVLKEQARRP